MHFPFTRAEAAILQNKEIRYFREFGDCRGPEYAAQLVMRNTCSVSFDSETTTADPLQGDYESVETLVRNA